MRIDQTRERAAEQPPEQEAALPDEPYYWQPQAAPPRRSSSTTRLGIALLLVGLLWLGLAMLDSRPFSTGDAGAPPSLITASRLVVNAESADVEVRSWDGDQIRVTPRYSGGSPDDYQISVRAIGDSALVSQSIQPCMFCARDLRYLIEVPPTTAVDISSSSGDIQVRGLLGELTASTASGDIDLADVGGSLNVNTSSGDIELAGVGGQVRVKSVSGDIRLSDGRAAQLQLSSTSGGISYEGSLAEGSNNISTTSGDVALQLPEESAFQLEASTVSGDLDTDFALDGRSGNERALRGQVGVGGANLKVETSSGDIDIEQD